jgi:hypothetical protein
MVNILCEELNQTSLHYLHLTTCGRRKDGKARKDHVIQTFWYESKFRIFHYLLPLSTSFEEERISLREN